MNIFTRKEPKPQTNEEKLIEEAIERHKRAIEADSDNFTRAREAIEFADLQQWPDEIKRHREQDPDGARPCLVLDKTGQYTRQIENDQRMARPAIQVRPVDDKADPKTAETYRGLIRNIEDQSRAHIAYDRSFSHAVNGGFGYFRILTDYLNEESFDQDIFIRSIRNRFSVHLDPDRQEPDGSDANWAFIGVDMASKEFKDQHPNAKRVEWTEQEIKTHPDWLKKDKIRVVEYYKFSFQDRTLYLLEDQTVIDKQDYDDATIKTRPELFKADDRNPEGIEGDEFDIRQVKLDVINEKSYSKKQLHWYKLTSLEILEHVELPGKWIPIVEVIGNEIDDDGVSKKSGALRAAMDAQRLLNYSISSFTEQIALQPKSPYIAAAGQIAEYGTEWENANKKNHPVLRYKVEEVGGKLVPPPRREPPPILSTGWAAAIDQFEHDIQGSFGMYNATVGADSNEKSGKALFAKQQESDTGNYHYQDNHAISIAHCGRILLDMIPHYYDTKRIARVLGDDGEAKVVQLDPNERAAYRKYQPNNADDGEYKEVFNIHVGKYDVSVSTGPSYTSKRQQVVDMLGQVINGNPEMMKLVGDLFFSNMDWQGAEDVAERLKRMLPPELQESGDDDEQGGPNQKFIMMIEQMKAEMQEIMEGQEARKIENENRKLDLEERRVEIEEGKANIDPVIEKLTGELQIIKDGLTELLTQKAA